MKRCVLAIAFTGSCALLYLYYRWKINSRRKTSEKNSNFGLESEAVLEAKCTASPSLCKKFENSSIKSKDSSSNEQISSKQGEVNICNINKDLYTIVECVPPKPNLFKDNSNSESAIQNINSALLEEEKKEDLSLASVDSIESKNMSTDKLNKANIANSQNTSNSNKCKSEVSTKSRRHRRRERKGSKSKENKFLVNDLKESQSTTNECKEKRDKCLLPKDRESVPADQLYTSDLERESSLTPEQENVTDTQSSVSQNSFDSGQGSIEVDQDTGFPSIPSTKAVKSYVVYQFKIPQFLVGRLIGKKGAFLNKLKSSTSVDIFLVDHFDKDFKLCSIEGEKRNVIKGLDKIRDHFPVDQFPDFSMDQLNTPISSPIHQPLVNRQILQLDIPPGVILEVQVSSIISTGEVWLQQPLHPTFSALSNLGQCMDENYGDGSNCPAILIPIPENTVCVCQINNHWYRCQVSNHDDSYCTVTLLDIGGTVSLPINVLRQIRIDYMSLPFQATQCFMYGIEPLTEVGWSEEGREAFADMVKNEILYATIAAYSQEGIPLINLYRQHMNQYALINSDLVKKGHAKWMVVKP